jgi:serine/threonine-protein kinase
VRDDDALERLLAAVANREVVDWDEAERGTTDEAERARIAALRGIERIAAHSHEEWRRFAPLVERARTLDAATLERWLAGLDAHDAADLRALADRARATGAIEGSSGEAAAGPSAAPSSALEPAPGFVVGAYTLEAPIGHGGMGEVWSARRSDGRFEGRVAVKLLLLPLVSRPGRGRFQREGEILARLRHPNIAQLLDAGVTAAGRPYLVLEYVDGAPIDRHCDERGLGVRERVGLFLGVLEAVAYAHANLVLHRDLKPSNVLVDREARVKLLDFGVAKLLEDESAAAAETEVTRRAGPAFTPEFASPEQRLGEPVTTATDVYSAGAVLYRLLTGRPPDEVTRGATPERVRADLRSEPRLASAAVGGPGPAASGGHDPRDIERRRRQLRGDLDNILARALRRAPAERYSNVTAFADDLRRFLRGEPVAARPDSLGYRAGKFVRRHVGAVTAASAAVLALAAVTVVAVVERREARRQRDEAREQARRADAFTGVVTSLLSQVGPGGRALGPGELLDRAVTEMKARHADDPAFLVDMLIRISGRYYDLRDSNKELATLVEAERVARGAKDPALVFDVQVNTVETELSLGRVHEATRRIEEARGLLPGLEPQPDLEDYFRAEAEVARTRGDHAAAIGYLERARALLESRGDVHGNTYPGILSELALSHAVLGDVRECFEISRTIVEVDRRHGREQSMPGLYSRLALAYLFTSVGEPLRSRDAFEEIIASPDSAGRQVPPALALLYADVLSRLGQDARALGIVAEAGPGSTSGGNAALILRSWLIRARVWRRAGRLADAARALDSADVTIRADQAPRLGWRVEARRLRADLALAEGRLGDALRDSQAALDLLGYPVERHGPDLPVAVLTLAEVRLARREFSEASTAARDAVELFAGDALDPARSADVGAAELVRARAALGRGDPAQARAIARRAAACLRAGLGPDHARTREAEALVARRAP